MKFEVDALPGVKLLRDQKNQGEFTVEGNDIENVSRTCALISQSCAVRNKVCNVSSDMCFQCAFVEFFSELLFAFRTSVSSLTASMCARRVTSSNLRTKRCKSSSESIVDPSCCISCVCNKLHSRKNAAQFGYPYNMLHRSMLFAIKEIGR